jgi:FkbM family methyltransferase
MIMVGPNTLFRNFTRHLGIDVVRYKPTDVLRDIFWSLVQLRTERSASVVERDFIEYCIANYRWSRSQIYQDLFVQFILGDKHNGFFVEFGATNGIDLSNSYALETKFAWNGILAEPARIWHDALKRNRKAEIDTACVWSRTGEIIEFNEVSMAEYSTISGYSNRDAHARVRAHGKKYVVDSISLADLIKSHNAPSEIDYLSIDTEGSEFEILNNFDFSTSIKIITVEHNYAKKDRELIYSLLTANGYERYFEKFSGWDDWYVQRSLKPRDFE